MGGRSRKTSTGSRLSEMRLTDKQEAAIRAAYTQGFFERPQKATAEDVATTLGISRSTFLYHLRAAEQVLIATVVDIEEQ